MEIKVEFDNEVMTYIITKDIGLGQNVKNCGHSSMLNYWWIFVKLDGNIHEAKKLE